MADEEYSEVLWSKVHEIPTKSTLPHFFDSMRVWIDKPHVVNRRLSGSLTLKHLFLSRTCQKDLMKYVLPFSNKEACDVCTEVDRYASYDCTVGENIPNNENSLTEIILRRLLPRLMAKSDRLVELVLVDKVKNEVLFIPVCTEKPEEQSSNEDMKNDMIMTDNDSKFVTYKISFLGDPGTEARIALNISGSKLQSFPSGGKSGDGVVCPSIKWLRDQLLLKINKWAENPEKGSKGSLRLVSLERYTLLYQTLKERYGWDLVKRWPENTDPQKFVFEDIAIATYLIILWEAERERKSLKEKQSFVDLGCGNGLLVYILCKEGYPGMGIDVRKRKIWDLYGPGIPLEERPLDPTKPGLFPKVDWLIGNHSDELTPWIPVMAARSSYNAKYFVLPCCFYDFNCKYVRKNNKLSQYHGYLEFVNHVGFSCGFQVEEDMLRIPSTKRICQIGQSRTYQEESQQIMDDKIKNFIRERGCDIDSGQQPQTLQTSVKSAVDKQVMIDGHIRDSKVHNTFLDSAIVGAGPHCCIDPEDFNRGPLCKKPALDSEHVSSNVFQPREQKIEVRNCSQLSKPLKEFIVENVFQGLLKKCHNSSRQDHDSKLTSTGKPVRTWSKGGSLSLSEVANLFDKETLKKLKNECGGIQTLLRNHRFIFKVVGGVVELQDWRDQLPGPKLTNGDPEYLKRRYDALRNTSLCWFHFNHPDGCVLQSKQCPYAHSHCELVDRPSQEYLKCL